MLPSLPTAEAGNPVQVFSQNSVCNPAFGSQVFQHAVSPVHVAPSFKTKVVHAPVVTQAVPVYEEQVYAEKGYNTSAIEALQEMQRVYEEYETLRQGMAALGYVSKTDVQQQQQNYAPQYVPYAQAPYVAGTTSYQVESTKVEAFGPQNVAEIMAMTSRYAERANEGANQLMARAQVTAEAITDAVNSQASSAVEVARIEAESRSQQAIAQAMLQAIQAAKPTSKTTVETRRLVPANQPAPAVTATAEAVAVPGLSLVQQMCAKCHGMMAEDPSAGVRVDVDTPLSEDVLMASVAQVASGKMPKGGDPLTQTQKLQLINELQALRTQQ